MKNKPLIILIVLLLLCGAVATWLILKSRAPNMPPVAALRLDYIDETNRVATLSDGGSRDADGTLQSWRIDWGDGQAQTLSSIPQKEAHTYASEGAYTISLLCVDNRGATSSPPAMTNITFDFLKRQKALELAQAERLKQEEARKQAEAKREADRLKEEESKKRAEAERLEQERKKELAAAEARKAREQQEMEAKRKAEDELARQKAKEAAAPPPTPLAAAYAGKASSQKVIYTPSGFTLGEFQIINEATEGRQKDGHVLVILVVRCVNFPDLPIPPSDWEIDGKNVSLQAGRIRASLAPGRHEVTARLRPNAGLMPEELKADVTVESTGECVLVPRK